MSERNRAAGMASLLAALAILSSGGDRAQAEPASEANPPPDEIVVTATRRAEDIGRVPLSVVAYTQALMDDQGIRQIDDLARLTPDVQFTHTSGSAGSNVSNIAIRGIASDVGAATTAIYIDDTPVQTRNVGYFSSNPYPKIFDLDRVEILRGPQGTLFGAGAEGGALRFLTPQPSLTRFTAYGRSEIADTVGGDPSYEAGIALGGPILADVLGLRASLWSRTDGGYINRLSPDTGQVARANANYGLSTVATLALAWKPVDGLTITPSIYYQNVYAHDRDQYWSTLSNPESDRFKQSARVGQPSRDQFGLPALRIEYDLDDIALTSNTSYFARQQQEQLDYSNYLGGLIYGDATVFPAGDVPSVVSLDIGQRNVTEELRAQSTDARSWLGWTAGLFYSRNKQSQQSLYGNGQSFLAAALIDGRWGQRQWEDSYDEQIAGYGQVDITVADGLKLTAGLRVSGTRYSFRYNADGVINGGVTHAGGAHAETPVTPKFGISYQVDPQDFVYATASKGFRPGGAQEPVTASLCAADLRALGYADGTTPETYASDSVWSYEAGAKTGWFGGRLRLDASVYNINWSGIQQNVRLPECGFTFVTNSGSATSVGGDVSARLLVTDALSVGGNVGYASTTLDQTKAINGAAIYVAGDRLGGPPLSLSAWAQYDFRVGADTDAFVRADYSFHSRTPSVDPRTFGYDPGIQAAGAVGYLSLRVGVTYDGWELSAFANNIGNDEKFLSTAHDIPGSPIFYNQSYRPPTVGLTAIYRFAGAGAVDG